MPIGIHVSTISVSLYNLHDRGLKRLQIKLIEHYMSDVLNMIALFHNSTKSAVKALIPRRLLTYQLKASAIPAVLLTVDDGPDETITPQILARLGTYEARAIFFVIGERAERYPGLVRQIEQDGHWIGNHTFNLPDVVGCSIEFLKEELLRCQDAVESITGKRRRYFRPPQGRIAINLLAASMSLSLRTIMWSNEGGEWGFRKNESARTIADGVLASLKDRQIILFHDNNFKVPKILDMSLDGIAGSFLVNQDIQGFI